MSTTKALAAVALILTVAAGAWARAAETDSLLARYAEYQTVIHRTAAMVGDAEARRLAARYGLDVLNVTWEDTGRFKGSCVGPNISDMTIQVQHKDPRSGKYSLHCMPVIRFPNFSDTTGDISPDEFYLLVGNEKGSGLRRISLRQFLGDVRAYLSDGDSWKGRATSLLADRDTHVLVSAQACFLPIPAGGEATFNPVLFNYQSYEGDPAVLTILVTREGTSVTVIDNKRDGFQAGRTWGQRLFFNQNGQRASLTGKRKSDHLAEPPVTNPLYRPKADDAEDREGLNMVLLIQVPLLQTKPRNFGFSMLECADALKMSRSTQPDVEDAVIGHGEVEGPFTEIDHLAIRRDPKYPIRVTVQFYKATSNGLVSEGDMAEIAAQIKKVYDRAEYVGSLVTEGDTGRPTEHDGPKHQPPGWWRDFWKLHHENTGQTPGQTLQMLHQLFGPNFPWRN